MWGYIIDVNTNRLAVFSSEPPDETKKFINAKDYEVEQDWCGNYYIKGYAPKEDINIIKSNKLSEINSKYNIATESLVSTYPSTELLTFDKQEQEARKWKEDNSIETPLIDSLAEGREIEKSDLVDRIIAKADLFALQTGYLTGQRQKYEDQLELASTKEEIEAIIPEYKFKQ